VKALIVDLPGLVDGELQVHQAKASDFASGDKGAL
jgi:hypothetical protein